MSRQMACQLTSLQVVEWSRRALDLARDKEGKYQTFGDLIDGEVADERRRIHMRTAIVVLDALVKEGLHSTDVQKVIRWREPDGSPGEIEIHYTRSGVEKRRARIHGSFDPFMVAERMKMLGEEA